MSYTIGEDGIVKMIIGGVRGEFTEHEQTEINKLKAIFSSYGQNGVSTDFLQNGNESGLFVNGNMPVLTVLPEDERVETVTWDSINGDGGVVKKDNTNKKGLIARLKEGSDTLNNRLDKQNELLEKSLKLQIDINKTTALHVEELKKQNKIQQAQLNAKVVSNLDSKEHYNSSAVKNAMQVQKDVLQADSLNFEMGHEAYSYLKDSNDEIIKPREAKAKKDAEKAIETKAMNQTGFDMDDINDMFDSFNENPFTALIDLAKQDIKDLSSTMFKIPNDSEVTS
jgi:hypothetical protein